LASAGLGCRNRLERAMASCAASSSWLSCPKARNGAVSQRISGRDGYPVDGVVMWVTFLCCAA